MAGTSRALGFGCVCLIAAYLLGCEAAIAQYAAALTYQNRGNRYEGLRTIAAGGHDIELLAAHLSPDPAGARPRSAERSSLGDLVRLRFFLPGKDKVFITIRQFRSGSTYYWLDRVTHTWRPVAINDFAWPTAPVLRQLNTVGLDDLGVVVRLGQDGFAKRERVVPAALFDGDPPDRAASYRFTLKTNGGADVDAEVYAGDTVLYRRPRNQEKADSPFTVVWPAGTAEEGWYRLVLRGTFEDKSRLDKEVAFYHRRLLSPSRTPASAAPRIRRP
jgi:hypothetical protein